jgi:2,4-dienoyl-CoA reductase-like NADH-dependent reductase (Old Yellow Enzyme family)
MSSKAFSSYKIGNLLLKSRIVRSATYEGASDENGYPNPRYLTIYKTLAQNNVGMIITGFSFVSKNGRAMQKAQAGIDSPEKIDLYKKVNAEVHEYDVPIIMQIAHTGRQTLKEVTDNIPLSSTLKKSIYFRQKPLLVGIEEIERIVEQFAYSAYLAKEAGFDGVQLHAAHGYLLHQFLLPETNKLKNRYGIDEQTGLGTKLIDEIFDRIKDRCGKSFPVLIKISGNHNLSKNFYPDRFDRLINFLDSKHFNAIEISYGTMDYALNIFRGDLNLEMVFKHNPIFRTNNRLRKYLTELYVKTFISSKFINFSPTYNLHFAERAKRLTTIPIISVGGFRSKNEIEYAIDNNMTDLVALSRPFICEPDFAYKLIQTPGDYMSKCKNCNKCVFMCDSGKPTTCYSRG